MRRILGACAIGAALAVGSAACASFSAAEEPALPSGPEAGADHDAPPPDGAAVVDSGLESSTDAAGMVVIAAPLGGAFAIDAREVTSAEFRAFVERQGALPPFVECPGKVALGPKSNNGCKGATDDAQPVTCVDWCDAKAYCSSVGKRLCGKIGGGRPVRGTEKLPGVDQWTRACMGSGTSRWPYGASALPAACNTAESTPGSTVAAGTFPQCAGGEPGLLDMSGNVNEWEDACAVDDAGVPESCLLRGGSFRHGAAESTCDYLLLLKTTASVDDVGIRCCKDL